MNLSCGSRTIKYLMFGFNLFFVISGIIIIAVGATVKTVYTEYADLLGSQYFSLPNMLIATGAFIFVISFFGCCGAIKESWIMLGIFSIFLCIIFIFEFASGIAGYVLRDQTMDYLDTALRGELINYNTTSHGVWDLIQNTFHCCGVDSYNDWNVTFKDYALPISCCEDSSGTAGAFYCNSYIVTSPPPSTEPTVPTSEGTLSSTESTASSTASSTETTASTAASSETSASTESTASSTEASTEPSTPTTTKAAVENPDAPAAKIRRRRALQRVYEETAVTPNDKSTTPPYDVGCKSAFGDYVKKHAVQIGGCALGLAIVQVLGIAFSCHLVRQLKNGYSST